VYGEMLSALLCVAGALAGKELIHVMLQVQPTANASRRALVLLMAFMAIGYTLDHMHNLIAQYGSQFTILALLGYMYVAFCEMERERRAALLMNAPA